MKKNNLATKEQYNVKVVANGIEYQPEKRLAELAVQGLMIKKQLKELEEEIKDINSTIIELSRDHLGFRIEVDGLGSIYVTERQNLKIIEPELLAEILGERFEDLVNTRTNYSCTDKLKEILADGDSLLSKRCREAVSLEYEPQITYRIL